MTDIDQLREDVRASAPRPSLEFAARMERDVQAGFKAPPRERRRISLWAPSVALACTALIAVVVGITSLGGSDEQGGLVDASRDGGGGASAQQEPYDAAGRVPATPDDGHHLYEFRGGNGAVPPPVSVTSAAGALETNRSANRRRGRGDDRVVVRRNTLALETSGDEFEDVSGEILRVADDSGSIVQSSRVSERDGRAVARYDLRVPSSRLDETLAELTELAHVVSRTSASQDITRAYVSATDRLDDARDQRDALLKALERADTEAEAEAIRRQLRLARTRISVARRDAERLERRADRSRVTVTLESTGRASDDDEGGAWTPGDAVGDAGRILEVAAGVVVVAAAALLPVAVLALLAGFAARTVRRRRREAALDAG